VIPDYYEFCNSTKIVSGTHAIEHIGYELASPGAKRPLVLTNAQLLELKVATVVLDALKDTEAVLSKVETSPAITVRTGAKVVAIEGDDRVTGLRIKDTATATEETLAVSGVFIETGSIPASEYTGGLVEINERGEIVVGRDCSTSAPGIYAAGDVTDGLGKQIIIAAGEGARAALAASRDLKRRA
jgi:alkyl hydroperoxide reductase subunit F